MTEAPIPENEEARLEDLKSFDILDTLPEKDYDSITQLASEICGTKISLVSLIDENRQWFKSKVNLSDTQTERKYAFCAHAILKPEEVMIVENAHEDERFHDNPYVMDDPSFTFYAGVPLVSQKGYPLGTLCVLDDRPKQLSPGQLQSLKNLSRQVMRLLELRKSKAELEQAIEREREVNRDLENFTSVAAHDLKNPLSNIVALAELLEATAKDKLSAEELEYLDLIETSSQQLKQMIDALLSFSKSASIAGEKATKTKAEDVYKTLNNIVNITPNFKLEWESSLDEINVNKTALDQILLNLVTNALKYNDKDNPKVKVTLKEDALRYKFEVSDNGKGIPAEDHERIFRVFETVGNADHKGQNGSGMGLANVRKIIRKMNGNIWVKSELGKGSTFFFTLEKQNPPLYQRRVPT